MLVTFLTLHLANHALGLISLGAMEAGRVWFLALWRHPLGTVLLYGALLTHLSLALFPRHRIEVRNRDEALAIRVVDDVRRLSLAGTPAL